MRYFVSYVLSSIGEPEYGMCEVYMDSPIRSMADVYELRDKVTNTPSICTILYWQKMED